MSLLDEEYLNSIEQEQALLLGNTGYSRIGGGGNTTARDEYGNTAKSVLTEKNKIARDLGQILPGQAAKESPYSGLGIADSVANAPRIAPSHQVEISDEYASRHRAERLGQMNILDQNRKGEIGTTQYRNEDPGIDRNNPTGWFERTADSIDDGYDDVMNYIFGKPMYKNKKEGEEAARADMNLQVNEDGNTMYSRQSTMNDESISSLRSDLMNAEEDPDADQLIYYARIDNVDGTSSYKIGLAGVDTFGRTAEEDRGKDITYLWTKRTKDAAKYEALFHGNRSMLKTRRNDIGTDAENYGAGKSEIYNADFMQLDGSASADKVRTLNMSTVSKMQELGVNVSGRYDSRGMELAYKELDKTGELYGKNSVEYKDMSQLVANLEHTGKKKRSLVDAPGDLVSGVLSSGQQVLAGLADTVLDASTNIIDAGQGELLDNLKSAESADETWGYKGRKEAEALGRHALREFDKGNYVQALVKGIQAAPDTVAQSIPDMVLMFSGVGTAAKAVTAAKAAAAKTIVKDAMAGSKKVISHTEKRRLLKDAMNLPQVIAKGKAAGEAWTKRSKVAKYVDPFENKGLALFASKQTNNQIDERLANGEDNTNLAQVAGMFASNYVLGGIDRWSVGKQLNTDAVKSMMSLMPKEGVAGVAIKAAGIAAQLVKAGTVEAGQEFVQTYGETINAALGTEKYGSNPFSDHFLDEATKGALLGFGAGGVMHGGVITAKGITGGLSERKRKVKVKDNKPFADTDGPLQNISPYNTQEEIIEELKEVNSNEVLAQFDTILEEQNIGKFDNEDYISLYKTLEASKAEGKITEDQYETYKTKVEDHQVPYMKDIKNILDPEVKGMVDKTSRSRFEAIITHAKGNVPVVINSIKSAIEKGTIDDKALRDFITFAEVSTKNTDYRNNLAVLSEGLGYSEGNAASILEEVVDDNKNDTDTFGAKVKGAMDKVELNDMETMKDVFESINPDTQGKRHSPQDFIQILLAVAKEAKLRDTAKFGEDKTTVQEVADFVSNLTQRELNSENIELDDAVHKVGSSATLRRVATAFAVMDEKTKLSFINTQKELVESIVTLRSYASRANNSMDTTKKTPEEVSYDVIVGDGSYDKNSLQEYLKDALRAMSIEDVPKREEALTNILERLRFWVGYKGTAAYTDKLSKVILEERRLKQMTLGTITNLRYGGNSKVESIEDIENEFAKKEKNKKETQSETSSNEYNDTMKEAFKSIVEGNADLRKLLEEEYNLNLEDC